MLPLIAVAVLLDPVDEGLRVAVVVALVLSLAGDVFLMLPSRQPGSPGPDTFVAGLASFLLAHLAYVTGFVLRGVALPGLLVGFLGVVVISAVVGRRVLGAVRAGPEPDLTGPVGAYVAVISLMVLAAFGTGDPRAMAGAALFAGSDSLIAWQRFLIHRPWMPVSVIVTYHLAQALLVLSAT